MRVPRTQKKTKTEVGVSDMADSGQLIWTERMDYIGNQGDLQSIRALGIGRGVLVLDVPAGSLAAQAGLKGTRRTETGLVEIGDIIVKVGGTVIETEANLFEALEDYKPGDSVEVKVLRIDAVNDQLTQRELTLNIRLQSSETLEQTVPLTR
ncbi:DegP2 peptidase [Nitzschia inconspicua]|uniref:DegP2 peptidase n=1 Tax=Nitzschia inconspicua TaxID=303405 RepID=A0A9K3L5G5_9STRA|nr:DegP2 peptidase [Nitzschia inconspicua]